LKGVADGVGGPSVAHTTNPSTIDTAANRKENPLMSRLKIDFALIRNGIPGMRRVYEQRLSTAAI
jgi:hypothetical protein